MPIADTGKVVEALIVDVLGDVPVHRTRPPVHGSGESGSVYYAIGGGLPDPAGSQVLRREVDMWFFGREGLQRATQCQVDWQRRYPSVVGPAFLLRVEALTAPMEHYQPADPRRKSRDEPSTFQSFAVVHSVDDLNAEEEMLLQTGDYLLLESGERLYL